MVVTLVGLWFGSLGDPDAKSYPTTQLVVSNLFFDGATVAFTYWALTRLTLPIAILLDIIASGLFAIASIWLGTLSSDSSLSFWQCTRILFAYSPYSDGIYIGGLFWVMHSTFLPTLIYLFLVAATVTAKYVTVVLQHLLQTVASPNIPLFAIVAATCAIFFGIFQFLGGLADFQKDIAEHSERASVAPPIAPAGSTNDIQQKPSPR